jgi:TP901 family phage tail tape measure protein
MAQHTVSINFLANAGQAQSAINNLSRSINSLSGPVSRTSPALSGMMGGLVGVAAVAGGVAAGVAAIAFAVRGLSQTVSVLTKFESAMLRIKSVVQEDGGDVAANMEYLEYTARRAGKQTRFSMIEAAEGLEALAKAGYGAGDAGESLHGILNLAQASGMGLGYTAQSVADMMTSFGMAASETTRVVDVLAMTAAKSTTDLNEIQNAFKYVGLAGAGMGQSFETVAAAMGSLAGAGVKASMAGTAIRGTLIQLADSSSAAHKKLLELGLTTEEIRPGKLNQLDQIMKRLKDKGVDANTAFAIFGQRAGVAGTAFTVLYDELVKFNGVLGNADGAAQRMADTMDSGLEAATLRLKNAWLELQKVIGDSSALLKGLTSIVNALRKFVLDLALTIQIMNNAAKNGELFTLLATVMKLIAAKTGNLFYNSLVFAFQSVAAFAVGVFSMLASPVFWSGIYQVFLSSVYLMLSMVTELTGRLALAVLRFTLPILTVANFFANTLLGTAMLVGGFIYSQIEASVNAFRQGMAYVMAIWQVISLIGRSMIDYILVKLSAWVDFFKVIGSILTDVIVDKLGGFIQTVKAVFSGIIQEAKDLIGWVANAFSDKVKAQAPAASTAGGDMFQSGLDRLGRSWGDIALETKTNGEALGNGILGAATSLRGKATEASVVAGYELGDAWNTNVADAMTVFKDGFTAKDVFGQGSLFEQLKGIVGRNLPKVPEKPPGEKGGRDMAAGSGSGYNGLGGGLAGANRMATNLIMGRTINEVIANIAKDQLDTAEDMLEEQKKTTAAVASLKNNGGVATFA